MKKRRIKQICFILIIIIVLVAIGIITSIKPNIGNNTEYFCDVKFFTLKTNIKIKKGSETIASIRGKVIRFFTDPLTMYDNEDNKIAYAGDDYHIIAQDSHVILVNNQLVAEMVGKFSFFGDKYDIYDMNGQKIATAEFNMFNSYGSIVGTDKTLWADYHSNFYRLDYNVRIKDECKLDDTTILMMMASFYSDRAADSQSSSNSNN